LFPSKQNLIIVGIDEKKINFNQMLSYFQNNQKSKVEDNFSKGWLEFYK